MIIPRTIHYCWFGRGEKPKLTEKCIASWEKVCQGYEIREWNEDNFDMNRHPYLKWCYENQKWAFFSDLARLMIVYEHGGIYLDTDVEMVRPFDSLLKYEAFFGFESNESIATGLGFGSVPGHPILKEMIGVYDKLVPDEKGNYPTINCPRLNTQALLPYGLQLNGQRQNVMNAEILPADYLNPYDDPTGRLRITENTLSIHWYGKSWMNKKTILRSRIMKPLHRIFGTDFVLFRKMRS